MGGNLWLDLCLLIKGFFVNLSKFGHWFLHAQKVVTDFKNALYYPLTNDLPVDVICDIAIYADDTTLYSKCDQASDLWQ